MEIQAFCSISHHVNALVSKTQEPAALVENVKLYSLLSFTDTWLTASILDANLELPDVTATRADLVDPGHTYCNRGQAHLWASGSEERGPVMFRLYKYPRWCDPSVSTQHSIHTSSISGDHRGLCRGGARLAKAPYCYL